MSVPTVPAGWPPAPGLDREEPQLWLEDDIPLDDTGQSSDAVAGQAAGPQASERGQAESAPEPPRERAAGGEVDADAQRTA